MNGNINHSLNNNLNCQHQHQHQHQQHHHRNCHTESPVGTVGTRTTTSMSSGSCNNNKILDLDDYSKYDRKVKYRLMKRKNKSYSSYYYYYNTSMVHIVIIITVVITTILFFNVKNRLDHIRHVHNFHKIERAKNMYDLMHNDNDNNNNNNIRKTRTRNSKNLNIKDAIKEFSKLRELINEPGMSVQIRQVLNVWLQRENKIVYDNIDSSETTKWIRQYLLPPIPGQEPEEDDIAVQQQRKMQMQTRRKGGNLDNVHKNERDFFRVIRNDDDTGNNNNMMAWEWEYEQLDKKYNGTIPGPKVDYTDSNKYIYPKFNIDDSITNINSMMEDYPKLQTLQQLLQNWPQDIDNSNTIHEILYHFNYSNPIERYIALQFRNAELPFKLYDIPEITKVAKKWSNDDYIIKMFDGDSTSKKAFFSTGTMQKHIKDDQGNKMLTAQGTAQESINNYFAFYVAKLWDIYTMGIPPTKNNDFTFSKFIKHAKYADSISLSANKPHYYWQSGVQPDERYKTQSEQTFISKDLKSFSSTTENFFLFHPEEQKGIQCRFGERGVVAATHFDGGRNMIAMLTGAKRYILSPPNQCSKLGIFTNKHSPIYRHSLLNFGHIQYLNNNTNNNNNNNMMSELEYKWLQRASTSESIETILKQGEVLYIPSHWFHYIISLQKSAQCNVRSGINIEGNPKFGGRQHVEECL